MTYRIPATNIRAVTSGFGAVFTDVDRSGGTVLRYFDRQDCLIATVTVPTQDKGLSFAGLIVQNNNGDSVAAIAKVVFKLGTISVDQFANRYSGSDNIGDLVVMDDFIYGEPQQQVG